jgi:acetylornithine/succinyldiaminopimelate/putrescine aminotransferase
MQRLCITRGENDHLFDQQGRSYIDLFTAHGTTWLGHGNREITAALVKQLGNVWISGSLETTVAAEAKGLVETFFPASHQLAGFYSTGMEAAEFAIRVARVVTGRTGVVGFEQSMHGKSLATAYLGWDNHDGVSLPHFHRLPFLHSCPEEEILRRLKDVLGGATVSAVFVEPLQGSGGGHAASKSFYQQVYRLCVEHKVLLVFDEILTGFYRTGQPFFFSDLEFVPDIILIGKAMGNGFPVSGVVVTRQHPIESRMLPHSTYSGNPLAAAAVLATLRQIQSLDLPKKVAGIEKTFTEGLDGLQTLGIALRGKGALWIIELPPRLPAGAGDKIVENIYRRGVAVGHAGRGGASLIRLLPAATIAPIHLAQACAVVKEEVRAAYS